MTGINAWVKMEHADHEPGKRCRDCELENDQEDLEEGIEEWMHEWSLR